MGDNQRLNWINDLVPLSKNQPVVGYVSKFQELKKKFISHLLEIGWTIESKKDVTNKTRYRFTSPEKKIFYCLKDVCRHVTVKRDEGGAQSMDIEPNNVSNLPTPNSLLEPVEDGNQAKRETPIVEITEVRRTEIIVEGEGEPEASSLQGAKPSTRAGKYDNFHPASTLAESFERKRRYSKGDSRKRKYAATKETRVIETASFIEYRPLTVLSWLVDLRKIKENVIVCYRSEGTSKLNKLGKVKMGRIKCDCCRKLYNLSKFEAHAGNITEQPSANIFFTDKTSLLHRQEKGMREALKCRSFIHSKDKPKREILGNESVCSNCLEGGELVLCDFCPAAYHLPCIGLQELPNGEWSCISCACAICSRGKSQHSDTVRCEQCHQNFHLNCLSDNEKPRSGSTWFCSDQCCAVFAGLRDMVGKPYPIGDSLNWWILQPDRENKQVDHNCKLWLAAKVLDECFVGLFDRSEETDLTREIVFNKRSKSGRINYKGFYTVILEKDDDVLAVALIRIFGGKVAEMPLIGTRFHHRGQGRAKTLVTEIEKMLLNLGVEKLVLPAAKTVLSLWTNSFKFVQSTLEDKQQLSHFVFIDFPETIRCHKLISSKTNMEVAN